MVGMIITTTRSGVMVDGVDVGVCFKNEELNGVKQSFRDADMVVVGRDNSKVIQEEKQPKKYQTWAIYGNTIGYTSCGTRFELQQS